MRGPITSNIQKKRKTINIATSGNAFGVYKNVTLRSLSPAHDLSALIFMSDMFWHIMKEQGTFRLIIQQICVQKGNQFLYIKRKGKASVQIPNKLTHEYTQNTCTTDEQQPYTPFK